MQAISVAQVRMDTICTVNNDVQSLTTPTVPNWNFRSREIPFRSNLMCPSDRKQSCLDSYHMPLKTGEMHKVLTSTAVNPTVKCSHRSADFTSQTAASARRFEIRPRAVVSRSSAQEEHFGELARYLLGTLCPLAVSQSHPKQDHLGDLAPLDLAGEFARVVNIVTQHCSAVAFLVDMKFRKARRLGDNLLLLLKSRIIVFSSTEVIIISRVISCNLLN